MFLSGTNPPTSRVRCKRLPKHKCVWVRDKMHVIIFKFKVIEEIESGEVKKIRYDESRSSGSRRCDIGILNEDCFIDFVNGKDILFKNIIYEDFISHDLIDGIIGHVSFKSNSNSLKDLSEKEKNGISNEIHRFILIDYFTSQE
jgi:hypothetical protein